MVQLSQSGRIVTLVAVSQGRVFYAQAGDTAWTEATNLTGNTPPLNFTGVIHSAANQQLLYFADGSNWAYFKPSDNTVNTWSPSAGLLPVDVDGNLPRLIATWRGRTVLSGLLEDPQNYFMSAVDDPHDFDYAPASTTPTQAVAGSIAPQGLIGDVITGLVPYTDDVMVVGCDHSVYMMSGDPMDGGRVDLISDVIGMAWGMAWCRDPYGNIYFFSNKCGIYSLVPGQQPVRISQQIEQTLFDVDTGANVIRLLWNDRFQGFHTFVTNADEPTATTHFFWEMRSGAWWEDVFANTNHNPVCCVGFDGNEPSDRAALIGSWDGYVRSFSSASATTDDGTNIASSVVIGPLLTKDLDEVLCKDLQAVLGETSGSVTFSVHVGVTAEAALASTAVVSGTWAASRNLTNFVRRSGHAFYVKIVATTSWAMEQIRCRLAAQGKVRRRGV